MNRIARPLALTVGLAALLIGAGSAMAQGGGGGGGGRGNFDPAQFQERIKERLEITNDVEWTAIQPLVEKVMQVRRETMSGMRGPGRRGGGGENAGGGPGGPGGRGGFGAASSPEADALQQSLDAKASADVLKAKLATFRDARKAKEAALAKAQEDLRKVLTVRQEATAALMGLLP